MITRRTKVQLAIFALITMLGVSFVGAKYAQLNRLFYSTSYTVVAHFHDSGGMYAGGLVSYRGVRVGQVQKLVLTHDGVDAYLDIDNGWDDKIPADTLAVVGNRSAVGEQYVDLQPQTDNGPYLHDGSQIADGRHPHPAADPEAAGRHLAHRRVGEPEARCARPSTSSGTAFAGTGPGPPADHRHRHVVHPRGQPELRRHHGPDPRQQHRAPRPDRLEPTRSGPSPATCGCSPAPWPATTATCAG